MHTVCDKVCELMFKIQRKIIKNRLSLFTMDRFFVKFSKLGTKRVFSSNPWPGFKILTKNVSMGKYKSRFHLCLIWTSPLNLYILGMKWISILEESIFPVKNQVLPIQSGTPRPKKLSISFFQMKGDVEIRFCRKKASELLNPL